VGATITHFTTTTTDGTYSEGDAINVTAILSKPIEDGAQITVTLDTGETVLLTKTGPYTMSGTYVVGPNVTSGDLTVTSYALTTPPVDADGLTVTSTTVPSGSMNIAGSHAIVIAPAGATAAGPPTANADTSTGLPGQVQSVNLLANDAAGTGATLDPSSVRLCGAGETSPNCTQTTVTVAGVGTYSVSATGVLTFTPLPTFTGTAPALSYIVKDSLGQVAGGTYTATVSAATRPAITIPAATVLKGATLKATVKPSTRGTVRVTVLLSGRGVCTTTKTARTSARMTVTCRLSPRARASIALRPTTRLRVVTTLTDRNGSKAIASRTVNVPRYRVVVPVTG
jgi:CshA-type fibril repeat protein